MRIILHVGQPDGRNVILGKGLSGNIIMRNEATIRRARSIHRISGFAIKLILIGYIIMRNIVCLQSTLNISSSL